MHKLVSLAMGLLFALAPAAAYAASASIGAPFPADGYAGIGTRVSFSVMATGFTNPTFYLTDSFPGGANTGNIDAQGNFVWVPNHDDIGAHTMSVAVSDSQGNSATATYSVTVVAPSVTVSGASGSAVAYGSPFTFSLSSRGFINPSYSVDDGFFNSSVASYNLSGTSFYWVPQLKDAGVHTLLVSARDTSGRYATTTQLITVLGPATAGASAVMPGSTVGAGQPFSFIATSTGLVDPAFTVVDQFYNPATTTFVQSGAKISWTPVYNDIGVHVFSIAASATDGSGRTASGAYTVTVVPYAVSSTPQSAAAPASAPAAAPAQPSAAPAVLSGSYVFKTYLALGSSGTAVSELQKKLIALNFLKGSATGYFGALTKKALQDFQRSKGLEPVGYTGPGTRAALNK